MILRVTRYTLTILVGAGALFSAPPSLHRPSSTPPVSPAPSFEGIDGTAENTGPAHVGQTVSPERWVFPIGARESVIARFRPPLSQYAAGHRGIDLSAQPEHELRAPTSGTVTFSGAVADRPLISVRVRAGLVYSIEPVSTQLVAGDVVTRGAVLGVVASGGHCSSRCVHLGVRVGVHASPFDDDTGPTETARYVDPLRFLMPKPVLLPW